MSALDVEDAREAVKVGAEALVVSNHGGRQLDGAPSSISVLPGIVDAVASVAPLLVVHVRVAVQVRVGRPGGEHGLVLVEPEREVLHAVAHGEAVSLTAARKALRTGPLPGRGCEPRYAP